MGDLLVAARGEACSDHQASVPPCTSSRGSAQTGGCDLAWTRGGVYQRRRTVV
jgi:hypothetical protein